MRFPSVARITARYGSREFWNGDDIPDRFDQQRRQIATVKRFGQSSFLVGCKLLLEGKDLDSLGPEYDAHAGAFPIRIRHTPTPIGAVVLAVQHETPEQNHRLLFEAMRAFQSRWARDLENRFKGR